jgi:hypothetical protein
MEMRGQFITLPTLQTLDSFHLSSIKWEAGCDDERNFKPLLGFEVLLFPVMNHIGDISNMDK